MKINPINNRQKIQFESKFRDTSVLNFGICRAIFLGDKEWFM